MRRDRIRENVLPVTVLSSLVAGSASVPLLARYVAPLAVAQSRKARPAEGVMAETVPETKKLARSRTVTGNISKTRLGQPRSRPGSADAKEDVHRATRRPRVADVDAKSQSTLRTYPDAGHVNVTKRYQHRQSLAVLRNSEGLASSASLPDQSTTNGYVGDPDLARAVTRPGWPGRDGSYSLPTATSLAGSVEQKVRVLRQNYFRAEMQFLTALEGISSRLVIVPKAARLSALRAELALMAQDLPAEVDIPLICPPTLMEGIPSRSRHHRIVRLNPAEATSLNSAEKVPYLLMLEVLREDFDFDPASPHNQRLLATLLLDTSRKPRRLFDTSNGIRRASLQSPPTPLESDSVFEPAKGDLASVDLLQEPEEAPTPSLDVTKSQRLQGTSQDPPRLSLGISTTPTSALATPRSSEGVSRSSTPDYRATPYHKPRNPNQADVSALADHMRTASQMLAQLELSAARRPKTEVAAIKAKIIASMQSLEENSFLTNHGVQAPNFDAIMAKATEDVAHVTNTEYEEDERETPTDPTLNTGRGADRMENDAKTGGIQRKGDRDDPSAATFGEAWEEKKERIRRSSPYGWAKNWDLVSVIVKTGADLRQEAFACQLLAICAKIWSEHNVDVWVKHMQILVTGESSGLIETITNAVSLHSLKRSLTLASVTAGTNPKKRIATLPDHFTKTFGTAESPGYQNALGCFVKSLAAYSIFSYVFQLKDRHNGNILIDADGHVIHIDFGFMLSNSPGNMGFEAAPFKLTFEYVELLGGSEGAAFLGYKELMKDAFQALRREADRIVTLVELMGRESKMACYGGGVANVVSALRARFVLEKSKEEAREWVEELITKSNCSYYSRLYDTFQYRTQGIY